MNAMSLILKLAAAIVVGFLAYSALTAEVLRPPPGMTQEEFARDMSESGRNVVVVRSDADPEVAARGVRVSGATFMAITIGLLCWAAHDFQQRRQG